MAEVITINGLMTAFFSPLDLTTLGREHIQKKGRFIGWELLVTDGVTLLRVHYVPKDAVYAEFADIELQHKERSNVRN